VLFVGRIHPEKGLDHLIGAFRILSGRFPEVLLRIVGPHEPFHGGGGTEYLKRLREAAAGLCVEFLEPVFDAERLAEIYRSGDVFCYPSLAEHGEAFPVAPLEAMASGLVPVVSSLECFADLIKEGVSGFSFDHRANPEVRLAELLADLLADPVRLERARREALRRAVHFSLERVARMYLEDFAGLVGEGPEP
jgi:glycosyltransferase involved in cell wall biosynthesis